MAETPLQTAERMLSEYCKAESRVLLNQEYEIGGKRFTMADLETIQKGIEIYEGKVARLKSGRKPGARIVSITPGG